MASLVGVILSTAPKVEQDSSYRAVYCTRMPVSMYHNQYISSTQMQTDRGRVLALQDRKSIHGQLERHAIHCL